MNIVIVGGGTAGWLAALMLGKNHPTHHVTVIASSKIGVLGAGEGVTGELMDVVVGLYGDLSIIPEEFFKETKAMPKYGIMHKGWTNDTSRAYFGPIDGTMTGLHVPDGVFTYLLANHPDKIHLGSFYGNLYEYNISPISKVTESVEISTYGFHMDARATAQYLEKIALQSPNIKLIDDIVQDVILDEQGYVTKIKLENTETIRGDFFIDASGFSRIIMKKLDNPWISYKKNLPLNAAIPFFIDYEENEVPKPYSMAWAQSAGWYWEAGVSSRKGCGYVYCEDFISHDQALNEIETNLGKKVKPLTHFKFDTGRLTNTWVKNCLAIGLCAAFAEPLEATSIHSTIKQLACLTFEFLKHNKEETCNSACIDQYNKRINRMFDDFKDFLVSHYMGGRNDSEFWKYISSGSVETDFSKNLKEMCKTKVPTVNDFPSYPGSANWLIWCYILAGTNQLTPEVAKKHLNDSINRDAIYRINQLALFTEKTRLTHYTLQEYFSIIQNIRPKFNPKQGVEWYLGKLFNEPLNL